MTTAPASTRAQFALPADLHYLNCAYMAPLEQSIEAAGRAALELRRDPTRLGRAEFFDLPERVRARFARLLDAPADAARVALIPAASYGLGTAARNAPWRRGGRVITAAEQFPSNVYPWQAEAADHAGEVVHVDRPEGAVSARGWSERLLEAIDARTVAVALPHVHWADGTRFDLAAIGARAHEVGAVLVVDGTQSIGAMPFSLAEIPADAVICAAYKWLFGPYSTGLAWFGEAFDGGDPLEHNWINRLGSDDFRNLVDYQPAYGPGAQRYNVGECSNFGLLPMLDAALALIESWTPAAVTAWCRALGAPLEHALRPLGYQLAPETDRAAHLFGIRLPAETSGPVLSAALDRHRVAASLRGDALRVSPHLYNDDTDIAALVEALAEAATRGGR